MGSAAIAKKRLSRLSWPEWSERVDLLLSGEGLSMADLPQYAFRSWHAAGVPSGKVAALILLEHGLEGAGEEKENKGITTKVK